MKSDKSTKYKVRKVSDEHNYLITSRATNKDWLKIANKYLKQKLLTLTQYDELIGQWFNNLKTENEK